MNAPVAGDPCFDVPIRAALPAGRSHPGGASWSPRARTVAHRSTSRRSSAGSTGRRYDVRVISLSDGSAVRRWRALGFEVDVIAEPDDARPPPCRRTARGAGAPRSSTATCTARRSSGRGRGLPARGARAATAVPRRHRPLLAGPQRRGPRAAARADARPWIASSRSAEPSWRSWSTRVGRACRSTSSTTASTSTATTGRRRAAPCPRSTASPGARRSWASSPAWSRRRATRPSSTRGRWCSQRVPEARLLIVGEGSAARCARGAGGAPRPAGRGVHGRGLRGHAPRPARRPGRLHGPARGRAGRHGGPGRGGAAVLPRGPGPGHPGGHGAVAPGGRHATWAASRR